MQRQAEEADALARKFAEEAEEKERQSRIISQEVSFCILLCVTLNHKGEMGGMLMMMLK